VTPNETTNSEEDESKALRRRLVSWPLLLIGLSLILVLAANTVSAWGRGGPGHGDVGEIKEHVAHRVDHMLEKIEASEEQTAAIQTIISETIDELHAMRDTFGSERAEIRSLLTAETIDRKAIEQFRASHLAHAGSMSLIVSQRLADVMEILTPEQRLALEERLGRHRGGHGRRAHDWH
jgi:Spy/CpxP family protein refolding chaperone